MNRSEAAGFTLIELLIVVALLGILATLTVTQIVKLQERVERDTCRDNHVTIQQQANLYLAAIGHPDGELPPGDLVASGFMSLQGFRCPSGGNGPDDYRVTVVDGRVAGVECTVSPEKHGITVFSPDGRVVETIEKPPGSKLDPDWIRP